MTGNVTSLRCVECGETLAPDLGRQLGCPVCGGMLDVEYDYERAAAQFAATPADGPERFHPLLPLEDWSSAPSLAIARTPLEDLPRLARMLGIAQLRLKDDGRLPTGCLKDRASWLGVAIARRLGYEDVVCASTGNAASSLAGMAANAGVRAHILVPADVSLAKLTQARAFGADVLLIDADYDDVYYLCNEVAQAFGWYNRNCAINPYLVEGKKTSGLELAEQLVDEPADWVAVAVGDGCTIAGVWKGLHELRQLGRLQRLPRLLGVQAAGANPIAEAFTHDGVLRRQVAATLAGAIAVGRPRNATKAMRAVEASGGTFVSVSDEAIVAGQAMLAARGGVFAEAGSAAAFAGVTAALAAGTIAAEESVVVLNTGNGLKDPTGSGAEEPAGHGVLACTIDAVRGALQDRSETTG